MEENTTVEPQEEQASVETDLSVETNLTPDFVRQDPDTTVQFFKELRNENANKRLKIKERDKENAKLRTQLKELKTRYADVAKVVEEETERKKQEEVEKAGEVEKVALKIQQLSEEKEKFESQLAEKDNLLKSLMTKTALLERKQVIDGLTSKARIQWASDFEREGFLSKYSAMNEDGFQFDEEDITNAINDLKQVKHVTVQTPGPGPKEKQSKQPLEAELMTLIEKGSKGLLSPEEMAKFNQLQMQITGA